MPWKLKHFSRSSVTEKSVHLIITLLALNQHSLAERGSGASGAKPNQSWLQVYQGPWPSWAHWSWNPASLLWGDAMTQSELSYHFNTAWETTKSLLRRNWLLVASILRSLAHHLPCSWLHGSYFSSCRAWNRCTAALWPGKSESVGLLRWSQLRLDKTHKSEVWKFSISWTSLLIMVLKNTQHVDSVPWRLLHFLLSFSSPN